MKCWKVSLSVILNGSRERETPRNAVDDDNDDEQCLQRNRTK